MNISTKVSSAIAKKPPSAAAGLAAVDHTVTRHDLSFPPHGTDGIGLRAVWAACNVPDWGRAPRRAPASTEDLGKDSSATAVPAPPFWPPALLIHHAEFAWLRVWG